MSATDPECKERIASVYDDGYGGHDPATVETLKQLAGGGRALELGIGLSVR